jgi:GLPGLI family protein
MKNPITMKRIILFLGVLVMLIAAHLVLGQEQGVITYETQVNMHRNLPPERQEMKSMIPEYRTTKEQLFFNEYESMYKPIIEDEEEPMSNNRGGGVRIMMRGQQQETYVNKESMIRLVEQELGGKKYLIEDTIQMAPWKFGTEIKEILGYTCKQAYYTNSEEVSTVRMVNGTPTRETRTITQEITVWYTDKIRPLLGPDRFNTLPGTVLAVDINNGERVIVARNVEFRSLKKSELKMPTAGTKTSRAEFRKLMDEQMERMRANGGGFIRN